MPSEMPSATTVPRIEPMTATPTVQRQTLMGQWNAGSAGDPAWVLMTDQTGDVDDLWAAVGCNNGVTFVSTFTDGVNLTNGGTYRIVVRASTFFQSSAALDVWVNGAKPTQAQNQTCGLAGPITNSAQALMVGDAGDSSGAAVQGVYSDFAVWNEKVPDWVAAAYGKGMSPQFYRTANGLLHAPLLNTSALRDVWHGLAGTNTSTTTAAHPSMYRPTGGQ